MRQRTWRAVAAATLAAVLVGGAATSAGATSGAVGNRLAGPDRFVTARVIAEQSFPDGATVAMLVSGRSFPDALAASFLSGALERPVFLTEPHALPAGLTDTMRAMRIAGVNVLGGTAAVSDAVIEQLRGEGFTVQRLGDGGNRYETARKIAELLPPEAIGEFGEGRAAFIATGESFPDALAAGPLSASQKLPILLTTPDSLNEHARAALQSRGIEQVLIVGGPTAVGHAVADEIAAMGIAVRRIAGPHRQGTAFELALVARGELDYPTERVLLARGDDFADALVGGTRGGQVLAPLLLTESTTSLGVAARDFIRIASSTVHTVDALGGTAAVSDAVVDEAVRTARGM